MPSDEIDNRMFTAQSMKMFDILKIEPQCRCGQRDCKTLFAKLPCHELMHRSLLR